MSHPIGEATGAEKQPTGAEKQCCGTGASEQRACEALAMNCQEQSAAEVYFSQIHFSTAKQQLNVLTEQRGHSLTERLVMKCFSRSRLCDGSYWPSNRGRPPAGLVSSERALGGNLAAPLLVEAADHFSLDLVAPKDNRASEKIPGPSVWWTVARSTPKPNDSQLKNVTAPRWPCVSCTEANTQGW